MSGQHQPQKHQNSQFIYAAGIIETVGTNTLTIIHEPIPKLSWPKMKMNFKVSKDIDLKNLKKGERIHFSMKSTGKQSDYMITSVHPWVHNVEDHNR